MARIVIVGGGLGGASLALLLAARTSHGITVIEQAPESVSRLSILYFMPFGKPGRVIFLKSTSRSTKGSICGRAIAVVLPEGWRC